MTKDYKKLDLKFLVLLAIITSIIVHILHLTGHIGMPTPP